MPEHPCAEGLSAACFKAYPEYARKALAYKILHQILPKQFSRMLPRMPIPPDFAWQERWNAWLYFIFSGDDFPWEYFPEGWKPGDPLPFGVEIEPNFVIPPDFDPQDHPPEFFIPGYSPIVTPPDTGPEAPIYLPPFTPGPIGGPHSTPPAEFVVGDLLATLNTHALSLQLGYAFIYYDRALAIETSLNAEIHAVDAMVGRVSTPVDSVNLQIWNADGDYKPTSLVTGGTSDDVVGMDLPVYDTFQDYVRFLFYDKPRLVGGNKYAIVGHRTGENSTGPFYRIGTASSGTKYTYARLLDSTWWQTVQRKMIYRIWGIAL